MAKDFLALIVNKKKIEYYTDKVINFDLSTEDKLTNCLYRSRNWTESVFTNQI